MYLLQPNQHSRKKMKILNYQNIMGRIKQHGCQKITDIF